MPSKNPEIRREIQKRYREKNKEKIIELRKEWKQKNPEYFKMWGLNKKYNITLEEYNLLFEQQDGSCAICGEKETRKSRSGKISPLIVDHDHETGKVRGLLCNSCNIGIALLREDPFIILDAIKYVQRNKDGKIKEDPERFNKLREQFSAKIREGK